MSRLREDLREIFKDEDTRYAYAEGHLNASIAAQIKSLRGEMSQEDLAAKIGTKQSGVSRLENGNYSSWKVETLRKLARAFGVRLRINFEEFGTLIPEIEDFKKNLAPRKFEDDPAFNTDLRVSTFADRNVALVLGQVPDLEAVGRSVAAYSDSFKAAVDSVVQSWGAVASAFAEQQRVLQQALGPLCTLCDYSAVSAAIKAYTTREPIAYNQLIESHGSSIEQTRSGMSTGVVERERVAELIPGPEEAECKAQNPSATGAVLPPFRAPVIPIDVNVRKTEPKLRKTRRCAARERSRRERYA